MKRTRFLRLAAVASALSAPILFAVSCKPAASGPGGGGAGGKSGKVIGFSQSNASENEWRTAETQSILTEGKARGYEVKLADAQGDQTKQIAALKDFIAQGVSAIVLSPKTTDGWEPVLKEVKAAGIPVILVDRGVSADPSLYATLIASDFVAEGRMAGEWLVKKTGGNGGVIQLEGSAGADPAIERRKGFEEALAAAPGLKILASQSGDFNRAKGKQVMEATIKAHAKAITAVYAHNDGMALGAIEALKEAGMNPGADVQVVSIDGIGDAFKALDAGTLNCTVECSPILGGMAFDAVEKIAKGETLEKKTTVQDRLFDATNYKAEMPNRKY